MPQFDVHRNSDPATRFKVPLLVDVQSNLLAGLRTTIVIPLVRPETVSRKPAARLNPVVPVLGKEYVVLTQELASVPRTILGARVASIALRRDEIIAAFDLLITGI